MAPIARRFIETESITGRLPHKQNKIDSENQ